MPTIDWLKNEFDYGYDSGDILSAVPDKLRSSEESKIGGSYSDVFYKAAFPYLKPDSVVMELGPGKGSWSRALLKFLPTGQLHTLDFQDTLPWLQPENYQGKLKCHQVRDNSFSSVPDFYFDFFWSFGVLCHQNVDHIREILQHSVIKMKKGGIAVHQYADWDKLTTYGWERGAIPLDFRAKPDDEIWWPRNNRNLMTKIAEETGWIVITPDLGLVKRDSIIVLKRW